MCELSNTPFKMENVQSSSSEPTKTLIIKRKKTNSPSTNVKQEIKQMNIVLKTYHHNPSNELVYHLTYFASVHKYDDRKTFKEEWKKWIAEEEIAELIQNEVERLKQSQYKGDALDKIYKSVRYYYVKKQLPQKDENGNVLSPPQNPRKKYECLDERILEQMDTHIMEEIKHSIMIPQRIQIETNHIVCDLSPAQSFQHYLDKYYSQEKSLGETEIQKYKKTFKNRFFHIRTQLGSSK